MIRIEEMIIKSWVIKNFLTELNFLVDKNTVEQQLLEKAIYR